MWNLVTKPGTDIWAQPSSITIKGTVSVDRGSRTSWRMGWTVWEIFLEALLDAAARSLWTGSLY